MNHEAASALSRPPGLGLMVAAGGRDDVFGTIYEPVTDPTAGGGDFSVPDFSSPVSSATPDDNVPDVLPSDSTSAPTYDDIFPALPEADSRPASTRPVRSTRPTRSNITYVHRVAPEDMRHLPDLRREAEQSRICKDIMQRTGTVIELSAARDGSLTFLIMGKEDAVAQARRCIGADLQAQSHAEIKVKKEHHRFLLGKNGKKLNDLQAATSTRITIPRQTEDSEIVRIVGPKDGIEKVIHEIQVVCTEVAARASEKLMIEKEYHPFVSGPYGETAKKLMADTGAKINIPPPSVNKNEIHISGETTAVAQAKEALLSLVADKKKRCQTVHVEVKKQQHRYVIGPKGQTLQEILKLTGVSIEMPPSDNPSETITLRGEQEKLGPALTLLYEKAHSEVDEEIDAPAWLQKYIIGPKGSHFQEISQDFHSTVNVSFASNENKIKIRGPKKDVEKAIEVLAAEVQRIKREVAVRELRVDAKYHRFLIGKSGQTINQIRAKTGAQITIPAESDGDVSGVIRIEGDPSEVDSAKAELEAIIKKRVETESNVSKDMIIEQRFHKQIIGTKGESIREIRDRFNQVVITFPESNVKSDKVAVRGPKEDVDNCCKFLAQLNKELLANNTRLEVPIFKQFHKFLIGKDGANIRKIRDETNTKIELPAEGSDSEVIVISGKKSDVELAREKVQKFQSEQINVVQMDIIIPSRIHNSIIGARGRLIRSLMDECGGVQIKFPAEGSGSDKVSIRGPKDCVLKAKNMLVELSNEKQITGFTAEIKAKPEHHRFLIGKNGANVRRVRDATGAKVLFPSEKEKDGNDTIVIVGRKEEVAAAKKELQQMIDELDKVVEDTVHIDPRHHSHFVARRGNFLRQIADEFGGVSVSFPRNSEKENSVVTLKGAKECVEGAKRRLLDEVSRLENLVHIEVVIDQVHHRSLMGTRGNTVKSVQAAHDVHIKFPERRLPDKTNGDVVAGELVNGDVHSDDTGSQLSDAGTPKRRRNDVIVISGRADDCEAAKNALLALIPVEVEVQVPYDYHRFIIGQKGKDVRELMERFDVSVSVPQPIEKKDTIRISGSAENAAAARDAILTRVQQLDGDKQDRQARSFRVELHVDPACHPKIIGKKGSVVTQIRAKHDVQIQFPERNGSSGGRNGESRSQDQTLITVIGYEEKALAAKEEILSLVKELESQVSHEVRIDASIHPRLIGARGKSIRRIMDQFKVDVKFPRASDPDPNLITISGSEEDVDAAKDHILTLQEEYLEDEGTEYAPPVSAQTGRGGGKASDSGFVVKGAPWNQQLPDTTNSEEFPSMGPASSGEQRTAAPGDRLSHGVVASDSFAQSAISLFVSVLPMSSKRVVDSLLD